MRNFPACINLYWKIMGKLEAWAEGFTVLRRSQGFFFKILFNSVCFLGDLSSLEGPCGHGVKNNSLG